MSTFKYADEKIKSQDIMIAVPSMVIAVGIFNFPATLAESTRYADGWVGVLIGGMIVILFTWVVAKLASLFPNQSFLSYSSSLVSKPVASVLTILFVLQGILIAAFEVSTISIVSHLYLYERTPYEVVAITFLLVVVYAVSGSRAGIFRINVLFLPLIFLISGLLMLFSINFMEIKNVLPVFTTDIRGYVRGTFDSALAYSGVGILFFYVSLVRDVEKVPSRAVFGMSWVVVLYLFVYLTCIAVFGQETTEVIHFPFIELAQSVEIPGGFFERMESIFFVIWITAIFTTAMMSFDVSIMALQSLFPKLNKHTAVFILSPIIYFIAMVPNNYLDQIKFGKLLSYATWILPGFVAILLWVMYAVKGGNRLEK